MSASPSPPPTAGSSLDDWLRWQERLHPSAIEMGLDRVREVAARMGLPGTGPATVSVAGTNGKGSTAAMLAAIYQAAGYRTGTYASPHLLRYNERVVVDGAPVGDRALCSAFSRVEQARGDVLLTYFEFGTLAALEVFRDAEVQVQVLEVGLGGRLDAVNLVDADAAVITNIGLDHSEYLGTTREAIAREKAGILRPKRPAVYVDADPCAEVEREASRQGAPLLLCGRDFRFQPAGDNWNWIGGRRFKKLPNPALPGAVQLRNAAGALAAVEAMQHRLPVPEAAIRRAMPRLVLPGRLERRGDVILDVGHNAEAAGALARELQAAGVRRLCLVLGMLEDKPVEAFVSALAPMVVSVYAAGLSGARGLSATALLDRVRSIGLEGSCHASPAEAYARARAELREGDTILVCGSFRTVANVYPELT